MRVEKVTNALGAVVYELDFSRPISDAQKFELRAALVQHLVLVFPDQGLTPEQQVRAAQVFGPVVTHDFISGIRDRPEVLEIRREPSDAQNFGAVWHSDNSYLACPPLGAVLHAKALPSHGGDTVWSNQYAAYEAMPPALRAFVVKARARHAYAPSFGDLDPASDLAAEVEHPLVRIHPISGRASLFYSGPSTVGIAGLDDLHWRRLRPVLEHYATAQDICFRHRWTLNDLVVWDNRCTMHRAYDDYRGERRLMHRVTIGGDPPISANPHHRSAEGTVRAR